MQANGNLADTSLRQLLETAQGERATGTLNVENGEHSCSIYFLFGHLFHAVAGDRSGDDAVLSALTWTHGDFSFDTKAKLPPDETVHGSVPDLIERAAATPSPAHEPEAPPASEAAAEPAEAEGWGEPPVEPVHAEPAAPADHEPDGWSAPPPTDAVAPEWSAHEAAAEPVHEEPAAPEPEAAAAGWEPPASAVPEPAAAEPPAAADPAPKPLGVKHRPSPPSDREPVPVPAGQTIYDSLKTSFVDFPRLVRTLEREDYTGYVRLVSETATGLILFRDGQALECVFDPGQPLLGTEALSAFNGEVTHGQGVLDVVSLQSELVDGLHELIVASPIYADLYASWVDVPKLLEFLNRRPLTGSLMARSGKATGVIILNAGQVVGAYTSESREIARDVSHVLEICSDPDAVIEVRSAAETKRPPLDVTSALGPGGGSAATVAPAPPASAPAFEQLRSAEPAPAPSEAPAFAAAPAAEPPAWTAPTFAPPPPETGTAQAGPPPVAASSRGSVDWERAIADLQQMAEDALGNRARKVKDILGGADRSQAGIEAAIDQVPAISLLFVDSSRLESLAQEMRAKLQTYL